MLAWVNAERFNGMALAWKEPPLKNHVIDP
jgi:hypothetical protein